MTSLRLPLLALGLLAPALHAASPDPEKLAAIPAKMQEFVDQGQISGIVTLVADRDRVLELDAVGSSDLASGRRMRTDDFFWIASMSKPMTAVGIAMLADDGKLSFDDPVSKFIPEFASVTVAETRGGPTVKVARPLTLRDLLTHTSGMGELSDRAPHLTLAETARLAARVPLRFQPGTRWAYSTTGVDMLGRVIEVASGLPFDRFMQQRLFDPLGMKEITFWPTPAQAERLAKSYIVNPQTHRLEETPISYMYHTAVTDRERPPLGGAGLFATAADIVKVYQMMLRQGELGGHRILRPATVAEMTRPQTGSLKARPGMPWGLGFCVVTDPSAMEANTMLTPGSFGHGGAYGTNSWADPTKGVIYILMLQRDKMGNPDNSPMHRVFQQTAAAAFP